MTNLLLFVCTLLASFLGVILFYRLWGKKGLFAWVAFASVLMNIETIKVVEVFGLSVSLGTILYASNFLVTDILNEHYGGKEARKAVWSGFAVIVAFCIMSQICVAYIPSPQDIAHESLAAVLGFAPRICAASLFAYLVSNTLDTYTYEWLAGKTTHLWIKNNLSTITSQMVDSFLFNIAAFVGIFPFKVVMELAITTLIIKGIIAVCDTPFAYWARSIANKKVITE